MYSFKKAFVVCLAAILMFVHVGTVSIVSAENHDTTKLTILHTNDTHAKWEESSSGMGYAKLATLINQYRAENDHTLLLDAGDTFHGTPFATVEQGASIARIYNAIGFDALVPGNHDFNYGYERLFELEELSDFPIISANTRFEENGSLLFDPYIMKEIAGLKIGIFGLSTPETKFKSAPKNTYGVEFTDHVAESQAMVTALEAEGADMIIALSHLGTDESSIEQSTDVAEAVEGIDLIIDGHSHSVFEHGLEAANDTLIVSAGEYTENLGVVEITFTGNQLTEKTASIVTKAAAGELEADPTVQAVIDEITEAQEVILGEVIGSTDVLLDGARENVRAGETNLGNLITDSMIAESGAEVAIFNGGGIRESIPVGEITRGDAITVLPFGNVLQTKELTGATIKAALEHGVSDYPNAKGAFPHVGGMTFEIDVDASAGQRVKNLQVAGEPVVLDRTYVVAMNDFMASGGDDYTMFIDAPLVNDYAALDEILIDYIAEHTPVSPAIEGRITEYVEPPVELPFTDVNADDWYAEFVVDLYDQGLIRGTSETTFSPSRTLTRAQFSSMLVRAFDLEATEKAPFTDIGRIAEETQMDISAAYEYGLVHGWNDGTFGPNKPLTRAQMAIMLKRAYELHMGGAFETSESTPFNDITRLDEEAQLAITMAYQLDLVAGYGDEYRPNASATRAQSAKVVSLFLALHQ